MAEGRAALSPSQKTGAPLSLGGGSCGHADPRIESGDSQFLLSRWQGTADLGHTDLRRTRPIYDSGTAGGQPVRPWLYWLGWYLVPARRDAGLFSRATDNRAGCPSVGRQSRRTGAYPST